MVRLQALPSRALVLLASLAIPSASHLVAVKAWWSIDGAGAALVEAAVILIDGERINGTWTSCCRTVGGLISSWSWTIGCSFVRH